MHLSKNGIKIGLISFASMASVDAHLTSDKNYITKVFNLMFERKADGSTNLYDALNSALVEFKPQDEGGYARGGSTRKIMVILSDGLPDDKEGPLKLASELKEQGVVIFTIKITGSYGYGEDPNYLRLIASSGCYFESDFKGLADLLEKLDLCL